jgi:hypothetical protein
MFSPLPKSKRSRSRQRLVLLTAFVVCTSRGAFAHNGPPFPIIENRPVGPVIISVWTNPDVGTGSFFVLIDPLAGGKIPSDLKVDVAVQPLSGRLPEKAYAAWRENLRGQVEYKTLVPFDAQEMWRVRVTLSSAEGSGEAVTNVEVTPPGLGKWDLLLYLLPFLGVGFLWFKAVRRRYHGKPLTVAVQSQDALSSSGHGK